MLIAHRCKLAVSILFLLPFLGCSNRSRTISGSTELTEFQEKLSTRSELESNRLTNADHAGSIPSRSVAIIGDGIAGAAAALNLAKGIRVYGSPSFWDDLQGLPEVWQTGLAEQFKLAHLKDPREFDTVPAGERIAKNAISAVYLKALIDANAAYLRTGPTLPIPNLVTGDWKLVDVEGHIELVSEALIVGTGLLRALRITDLIPSPETDRVRRSLMLAGKIMTGDEYLAMLSPKGSDEIVGIVGAGGNSADCIIHALEDTKAREVVVWGQAPPDLIRSKSYQDMVTKFDDRICRVKGNVTNVSYDESSGRIAVNGNPIITCQLENNIETVPSLALLVESLGRYRGDPPPVVASAARGRTITYHPVVKANKLIAVRVSFGDDTDTKAPKSKPIYLIGAAATWIPPAIGISKADLDTYNTALVNTVAFVNSDASFENAVPGFAVAAFMGSQLATECFKNGKLAGDPDCQ